MGLDKQQNIIGVNTTNQIQSNNFKTHFSSIKIFGRVSRETLLLKRCEWYLLLLCLWRMDSRLFLVPQ